jgi:hypothetical protein
MSLFHAHADFGPSESRSSESRLLAYARQLWSDLPRSLPKVLLVRRMLPDLITVRGWNSDARILDVTSQARRNAHVSTSFGWNACLCGTLN